MLLNYISFSILQTTSAHCRSLFFCKDNNDNKPISLFREIPNGGDESHLHALSSGSSHKIKRRPSQMAHDNMHSDAQQHDPNVMAGRHGISLDTNNSVDDKDSNSEYLKRKRAVHSRIWKAL